MMAFSPLLPSLLTSALCFLGLPAGQLLAKLASDEIPAGKRHFTILRQALAALVLLFGIEQFLTTPIGLFGGVVGIVFILSRRNLFSLAYPLWGLLLGLNLTNDIALLAGCVFLYGLAEASLRPVRGQKGLTAAMVTWYDLLFFALLPVGALAALAI